MVLSRWSLHNMGSGPQHTFYGTLRSLVSVLMPATKPRCLLFPESSPTWYGCLPLSSQHMQSGHVSCPPLLYLLPGPAGGTEQLARFGGQHCRSITEKSGLWVSFPGYALELEIITVHPGNKGKLFTAWQRPCKIHGLPWRTAHRGLSQLRFQFQ